MEAAVIANLLRKNELLVARLYLECARLFPDFSDDFKRLASEEEFHAAVFNDIMADIATSPGNWKVEKISALTVDILHQHLTAAINDVVSGKAAPRYAITILKSFEQGMTERAVSRILICSDSNQSGNLAIIDDSFKEHYMRLLNIEKRIFGDDRSDEY